MVQIWTKVQFFVGGGFSSIVRNIKEHKLIKVIYEQPLIIVVNQREGWKVIPELSTKCNSVAAVHSHVVKIEAITEKILLMNLRGDRRINEGERGG